MKFYCLKCKTSRNLPEGDFKVCRVANRAGKAGTPCAKGKCPQCDTTMCRFVKKSASPKARRCK